MLKQVFISLLFSITICISHAQNMTGGTVVTSTLVLNNNVSGGGFQSDVTISADGMTVYSSADVSGIFKSKDGGLTYKSINEGLQSTKVASLAITPDNEQILYAGTGNKGESGGLFRSCNGGESWELTAEGDSALFSGNHSEKSDPVPDGHPRSNGDLIIVDTGDDATTYIDDIVIAGTYKDGVIIFGHGGDLEASVVQNSGFVRSVAYHSAIPKIAYAAIQFEDESKNGIYRIDFTDTTNPKDSLVFETPRPEGLEVLSNGHVYGAIGEDGVVKFNGNSWSVINSPNWINNGFREWTAVSGYVKSNTDVIYAAVNNLGGSQAGTNYSSIWRKIGGNDWIALVDADTNISDIIYGQTCDWWYSTEAFPQASLGHTNNVISAIDISVGNYPQFVSDDIIYISGRGGIWKSEHRDELWKPAVYNMAVTANNGVAVNPNNPSQIALANTDYVVLETANRFVNCSITRDKPNNSESKGFDVIFDTIADAIVLGVGDRDNNIGGNVFIKDAIDLGDGCNTCWTNTDLLAATSGGRARAVSYGYHDGRSTTNQIILAAVEGEGVFRYQDDVWTSTNSMVIESTRRSNFVWPNNTNSGIVYLLDLSTGLHRSIDGGQNWTNIWPSMSFNNNDFFNSGYITADDNDPTTLFVSIQGHKDSPIGTNHKVYRMLDADANTFGSPTSDSRITDISFHSGSSIIKRPGPLVFGDDNNLWLTQQQNSPNSINASLFVMENPKTDLSFKDVTTKEYADLAIQPSDIDASSDGYVYVSQSGTGVVKVQYSSVVNIGLSNSCIEVFPDPISNLYTISGTLPSYTIEIIDANGVVYSTLCNEGTAISFDVNALPAGIFSIRVSDNDNNQLHLEQIIKF